MPPECQLFTTLGCHLCELAEEEIMPLVEHGLMVELIDIADSEALFEAYGLRIPVLRRVDTGTELSWPFDVEQVVAFLR
ncbi:glutaredoxin family protein [Pseudomonas sp. MPB23]|jgi:hypothetical protein|uniref:glutaredoxin family protein n=1 Tax=Pseudomonas sp. MPB23 TaxID=3388490 RepID=UPI00398495FE